MFCCERLPVPREQLTEPIDLVIMNAVEHIGEIGLRVDAVHLRRFNDRHRACQSFRAGVSACEQPIPASNTNGPQGVGAWMRFIQNPVFDVSFMQLSLSRGRNSGVHS